MNEITEPFGYEIVGLPVTIVSSKDPTLPGVCGEIILETMNTIKIKSKSKIRTIPKATSKFEFIKDSMTILIDGVGMVGRPEDRITKVK